MPNLNLYLIKPQQEKKAAKELRQARIRAYVPRQRRDGSKAIRYEPSARGYLAATSKPYDAQHVGRCLGTVTRDDMRRLYVRTSKTQRSHAYKAGDRVLVKRGHLAEIPATIVRAIRVGWYEANITMLGKHCLIRIDEPNIHPHK